MLCCERGGNHGTIYFLCLDKLEIGYSYTISIENQFIRKGSFITFPETRDDLQFELEILYGHGLDLSIFGGRGVCVCACVFMCVCVFVCACVCVYFVLCVLCVCVSVVQVYFY